MADMEHAELSEEFKAGLRVGWFEGSCLGLVGGVIAGATAVLCAGMECHIQPHGSDRPSYSSVGDDSGSIHRCSDSNGRIPDSACVDGVVRGIEHAGMRSHRFGEPVQQYTMLPERRYNHGIKRK